ncbi:IMP cyclohydrolase [Nocardia rhamnosiphila]
MPIGIREFVTGNRYPGRVIGFRSTRRGHLESFIMLTGRSPASKACTLEPVPGGDIVLRARATDSGRHDELRHYPAVIADAAGVVVANGDHSLALHAALRAGNLDARLAATTYEPDPPINTSRVAVSYELSTQRIVASISAAATTGHDAAPVAARFEARAGDLEDWIVVSTYLSDGTSIEPNYQFTRVVSDTGDPVAEIWTATDARYRVAAAAITFDNGIATVSRTEAHTSTTA